MQQTRWPRYSGLLERAAGLAALLAHLAGPSARRYPAYTLEQRLAMLLRKGVPVGRPVTIYWNRHHVPFIEAAADQDLAVALGVVHAHLRLGQLEMMRRLAQGRVSELIGPVGIAVDQLLRTLDVGRAVPAILTILPVATRSWLEGFVQGLNHHVAQIRPLPPEFELLNMQPEPWSVADILTLGRLVSADVNWIVWFQLLRFRGRQDWPQLWRRLLAVDSLSCGTGASDLPIPFLRFGSNSFIVGPSRSATGHSLIASDPHLAITLPNTWLLAACSSPSYQMAGLMIPGLPFVALGRNRSIAWGGTSLHATSSELVAVPAGEIPHLREREARLTVRWGRPLRIRIRESEWGPIVTDVPLLAARDQVLAMRWMGHQASDETTAMLAVNRATSWAEFRTACEGFALPGQNMLCAEASEHIGRLMAVHVPRNLSAATDDMVVSPAAVDGWGQPMNSAELPCIVDPPAGCITSANERPPDDTPPDATPVVGRHFSSGDRKQRLDHLLSDADMIAPDVVAQIQCDTTWEAALDQKRQLLEWLGAPVGGQRTGRHHRLISELAAWDGRYEATSRGALVFELCCHQLARLLVPRWRRKVYNAAWGARRLIWSDIASVDPKKRQRAVRRALRRVARAAGDRETWGNRHRLRLAHPLALIPLVGRAWRFTDVSVDGASDTLMKTAHALTDKRHGAGHGSVARHISDMSDIDRNQFVLLGGQDGWPGSTTFLDQVPLWQRGEYISVPLRPETARATFKHSMKLDP